MGRCNCLSTCSNAFVHCLESAFHRLGLLIGRYPWWTILLSLVLVACFIPGIPLFFFTENRQEKLWVASNAEALKDKEWVDQTFPSGVRFNSYIVESQGSVLTATVIKAMLEVDKKVKAISKPDWYDWQSTCARLGPNCWSNSLLELWSFDENAITALTDAQVLDKVNSVTTSPVYGNEYNIEDVLGDITRDGSDRIISAKATIMNYFIIYNYTVVDGTEVDERGNDWELGFLELGEQGQAGIDRLYYTSFRSFGDEGGGAITGDLVYLFAGYILIIIFVCVVLGKFSQIEQRIYVCLAGIACIGLAIGVSFGLCSYAGFFYSPLHSVLPFLILGIGVDDMFVIVGAWENIKEKDKDRAVSEKIGLTLRDAGVSITITSFTDILAFGIGATTIIPALQSFCVYCCFGILATFLLQATFFVACFAINEKRAKDMRNACCCCYKHPDTYEPSSCGQKQFTQYFFDNIYTKILLKLPTKIAVIVVTAALLGVNIWGSVEMEQEFDATWFIPSGSYASAYIDASARYFPSDGIETYVYIGAIDYYADFDRLMSMHGQISADEYTKPGSLDAWFYNYQVWLNASTDPAVTDKLNSSNFPNTESDFYMLLQMYLTTASTGGSRFIRDIVFGDPSTILASRVAMTHVKLDSSSQKIAALDRLRTLTREPGLGRHNVFPYTREYFDTENDRASRMVFTYVTLDGARVEIAAMERSRNIIFNLGYPRDQLFPYTFDYLEFESNKVIQEELYRNLGLAFLCVFVMCLILIANLWACLLVALCVIVTLVDVVGSLHFWGLTIDVVTSVNLIVAIGLAVDYSAHIAHTFMVEQGSRYERTKNTLSHMAPAVFYGGFSTFLAFVLLAGSNSYVFSTFFKVFFLVVVFGLFHGLVLLPVLLSWLGPAAYGLQDDAAAGDAEKHHNDNIIMVETADKPKLNGNSNQSFDQPNSESSEKNESSPSRSSPSNKVVPDDGSTQL